MGVGTLMSSGCGMAVDGGWGRGPCRSQTGREVVGVVAVDVDDFDVGAHEHAEAEGFFGDLVPAGHGDDDDGLLEACRGCRGVGSAVSRLTRV